MLHEWEGCQPAGEGKGTELKGESKDSYLQQLVVI